METLVVFLRVFRRDATEYYGLRSDLPRLLFIPYDRRGFSAA